MRTGWNRDEGVTEERTSSVRPDRPVVSTLDEVDPRGPEPGVVRLGVVDDDLSLVVARYRGAANVVVVVPTADVRRSTTRGPSGCESEEGGARRPGPDPDPRRSVDVPRVGYPSGLVLPDARRPWGPYLISHPT